MIGMKILMQRLKQVLILRQLKFNWWIQLMMTYQIKQLHSALRCLKLKNHGLVLETYRKNHLFQIIHKMKMKTMLQKKDFLGMLWLLVIRVRFFLDQQKVILYMLGINCIHLMAPSNIYLSVKMIPPSEHIPLTLLKVKVDAQCRESFQVANTKSLGYTWEALPYLKIKMKYSILVPSLQLLSRLLQLKAYNCFVKRLS